MNEWGNADLVVQNYIVPKSTQVSLLRYEINENMKIKAYIILSPFNIADIPFLEKNDVINKRKQNPTEVDTPNCKFVILCILDDDKIISKSNLDRVNPVELQKYF